MEKIIQINYQNRNFSIEENAYQAFQTYELKLKEYFSKEEGGDEIFADLQYRMAEILDQQVKSNNPLIMSDIDVLISAIGNPSDFEEEDSREAENTINETKIPFKKKKLFRDKKDKIIAGVCSGIANYFAIDPIAVRLIFVLFALFNVATLFKFNLGILAYIGFWIALTPASLTPNITRKLFRNPKDQILGGVCSGLAQFFNVEAWIIRLIFVSPIVIGFASRHSYIDDFEIFGKSFYSLAFISYIILWFVIPLAKVSTDYMLLKGEPININTIQNTDAMKNISQKGKSSISVLLKVIAYIILAIAIAVMIPSAIAIIGGSIYSYSLADIILFSEANKVLAALSIAFFVVLPLVGFIVWLARKVLGYKSPNKSLRMLFIGLNTLGWVATFLLIALVAKDNNTISKVNNTIELPIASDTLYVESLDSMNQYSEAVFFEMNQFDNLIERTNDKNNIKAIRLHYKESNDSIIKVVVEKTAFGTNKKIAFTHAENAVYHVETENNRLKLSSFVSVNNKEPYHFQNVLVTIYYPKNKTIIVSKELKKQLSHSFRSDKSGIHIRINDDGLSVHETKDEVINGYRNDDVIRMDENNTNNADEIRAAQEELVEKNNEHIEQIKEKQQEIIESQKELDKLQKDAQKELEEAQKKLNKTIQKVNE
jgi:phage shock protein PspC (stress-responsive transcriptional regulator)